MVCLTLGAFDLLHVGHLNLLQRAAALGDKLYVGVNSDRFVEQYKRPTVVGEKERMRLVGALRCVDQVFLNDGQGRELIERLRPSIIAVGSDWHQKEYLTQIGVSQEWLVDNCVAVAYLPRTPGVSTTQRRRLLAQ